MQRVQIIGILYVIVSVTIDSVLCWDSDELEVFDVVEEVNQNFYTLLDVPQNANQAQIKKAFRRLSLVLHPDKNDAPDAEVKFRQLVAVYDILKDSNKRKCYDNVLENGLPDWKQVVYYYRRVRKMGLTEMSIILFIIISIGQYLVGWAQYLEYKFTIDDYLSSKTKRLMKKQKKGVKIDTTSALPPEWDLEQHKPSVMNTLPFQLPRFIWFLLVSAPPLTYRFLRDYWDERQKLKLLEAEEQEESEEEEAPVVPTRGPRRRKAGFTVPELKEDTSIINKTINIRKKQTTSVISNGPPIISGGLWTDDDLAELVRLVKKFPVGTTERWEKIGEFMRRPAAEVAHMAHKVKENMVKSLSNRTSGADGSDNGDSDNDSITQNNETYILPEEPKKVKTRGGKLGSANNDSSTTNNNSNNWSQIQQKALETALAKYPKSGTADRWEKIAKCVPNKTKMDLIDIANVMK
ncbi:uncharacterized protein F54F2.9 isoform X2 [Lycorma delicatula]|uniref:uncharacterized protein F54F2.9 isoform X2 n=1 Tax=Lycorma delicatula TaxID=130591 RepID=UPI003F511307